VRTHTTQPASSSAPWASVRRRIERAGERLWRLDDFGGPPIFGGLRKHCQSHAGRGLRTPQQGRLLQESATRFGKSLPSSAASRNSHPTQRQSFLRKPPLPISSAFTTQTARRGEGCHQCPQLAPETHWQRDRGSHPATGAWAHLSGTDAALLTFLRRGK